MRRVISALIQQTKLNLHYFTFIYSTIYILTILHLILSLYISISKNLFSSLQTIHPHLPFIYDAPELTYNFHTHHPPCSLLYLPPHKLPSHAMIYNRLLPDNYRPKVPIIITPPPPYTRTHTIHDIDFAAYSCHGRWFDAEGTQFVIATPLARPRQGWSGPEGSRAQPYRNSRRLCFMYRENGGVVSLTASTIACQRGVEPPPLPLLAFNATSIGELVLV